MTFKVSFTHPTEAEGGQESPSANHNALCFREQQPGKASRQEISLSGCCPAHIST